jgi:hypothetical protein
LKEVFVEMGVFGVKEWECFLKMRKKFRCLKKGNLEKFENLKNLGI